MPRRSGVFGYLKTENESNKLEAITRNCDNIKNAIYKTDPANFIINLRNYDSDNNPFMQQGFNLTTSRGSEPHLRVDESYESSRSDIKGRIYLSYCHGTETFVNGTDAIIVHYYFDEWGQFQTLQCKKNGEVIELTPEQIRVLQARANQFQYVIENLLNIKAEQYRKLSDQLEKERDRIMKICLKGKVSHEQITSFTSALSELAATKDRLENNVKDARTRLFINMIQNLYKKQSAEDTVVTQQNPQTQEPLATAAAIRQDKTKAKTKPKTAPKLPDVDLDKINKEYLEIETINKELTKIIASNDKPLNAKQIEIYLEKKSEFCTNLLQALMSPDLNAQQRKKIDELWDKSQKLITEMTLFEHAIQLCQLDIVELLFPYCSNCVSLKFYNDMLFNAIKSDKDFEKILDFLSENCPVFNNTIHQQIRLYYRSDKDSPVAYNILYQAYLADNKKLFAALLKYGVNPFQPWLIAENIAYPALYAIALRPSDTDFYVNTLLDKGVTFTNNDPKVDLKSASSLRSIARTSTAMQRHSAKKELQQLAVFNTEFGDMHEEFATTPEYTPYYEQGLTHLITMITHNPEYFKSPKLFGAMVSNSDISSTLAALSTIATNIYLNLSFLFTSKMPGFYLASNSAEINYKRGTLHSDSQDPYIHTLLLFPEGIDKKDKQLLQACTQELIEKINAASTSEPEIAEISANLSKHVQLLNLNKKHDVAAMYRVATVLLHSMKHNPSNSDRIECVKQLCEAAKDLLLYIEIEKATVRQAIQTRPRDPATQGKIANFTNKQAFVYANVTRFYFDAITMACLGMPEVPIMPEVTEAQTALKDLLKELKTKDKQLLDPGLIKFYEDQLQNTYDGKIAARQRLESALPPKSTPRPGGFN